MYTNTDLQTTCTLVHLDEQLTIDRNQHQKLAPTATATPVTVVKFEGAKQVDSMST